MNYGGVKMIWPKTFVCKHCYNLMYFHKTVDLVSFNIHSSVENA